MDRSTLMEAIERRAFDARIALTKLCTDAKVSPTTASRWKSRQAIPSLATIGKLEKALEIAERKHSGGAIGSSAGTNGTGPSTEQED